MRSNRQPSGPDRRVLTKQMEAPAAKTEVLDDVENFHRFFRTAPRLLVCNDEVNVDVGMDEVSVGAPANGAFDSHQAVLLVTAHKHQPRLDMESRPEDLTPKAKNFTFSATIKVSNNVNAF